MAPARIIKQEPGEKHFFSRFRPVCIRCRKTFSISALEIVQVAASVQCVTHLCFGNRAIRSISAVFLCTDHKAKTNKHFSTSALESCDSISAVGYASTRIIKRKRFLITCFSAYLLWKSCK
ncbi:hypothetical protein B296_00043788 [Ensete ventricosum]|uniref:Uncharacterized protein n=1 Tax=Ensete ventricosum TaxID=4639 RepID=A0A426ZDA0_ENSVE|nr:hypothetical protein B296_00043788 [Ensete ventricosum]